MYIVLGTGSFKIKEFTSAELDLTELIEGKTKIQYRQVYFHFCYIPIFGTSKRWVIANNGKHFHLNRYQQGLIREKKIVVKNPWYNHLKSYLFFVLIALFLVGAGLLFLFEKYMSYRAEQRDQELQTQFINNPKAEDYYQCFDYNQHYVNLKLDSVTPKALLFSIPVLDEQQIKGNVYIERDYYYDTLHKTTQVWVDRSLIAKAHCSEDNYKYTFKGSEVPPLRSVLTGPMVVSRIRRGKDFY
jgi:sulfur relay (sulfurtransferase) DsrF/TusC family protein